tara:strand:+ start:15 stop:626 length:612 start_codon:yes stop_codon:yes gene_type:complete
MQGQINTNSKAGKVIIEFCSRTDVTNIVEIGTWNGMGSTQCVYEAIKGSNKNFISIEADPQMYELAVKNNRSKPEVSIFHGKISDEMIDIDSFGPEFFIDYSIDIKKQWYKEDIFRLSSCDNILNHLPNKIDFLILDGGEFTSYSEYKILKPRSRFIFCDDTSAPAMKNVFSRKDLLENHKIIYDFPEERNGFCLAENISIDY